jgi:hypothetical protein
LFCRRQPAELQHRGRRWMSFVAFRLSTGGTVPRSHEPLLSYVALCSIAVIQQACSSYTLRVCVVVILGKSSRQVAVDCAMHHESWPAPHTIGLLTDDAVVAARCRTCAQTGWSLWSLQTRLLKKTWFRKRSLPWTRAQHQCEFHNRP